MSETAPPAPARTAEMRTRFVVGPILIAAVVGIYLADLHATRGYLSAGLLGLLGVAGLWEYVRMVQAAGHPVAGWLILPGAGVLHFAAFWFGWGEIDRELYPPMMVVTGLLFPLSLRALGRTHFARGMEEMGFSLLGLILIAWPFYLAQGLALRLLPALFFVVAVSKLCDTGAYLAGSAFGRHRLIPHVSPGKSVEGALGGLATAVLAALLLEPLLLRGHLGLSLTGVVLVAIMVGVTAQVGDLVESLLKRRCGVKDSSRLLPVHGGVLDLVDSLLFSIPAFFVLVIHLT